jgi:integrase
VRCGLPGPDRWALYLLAAYSGFRCGELAALALSQLQLDSEPPCVVVAAADEKAGRGATIPLPAGIRRRTAPLAGGAAAAPRVFPGGSWQGHGGANAARRPQGRWVSYRDVDGRVFDFHALRSQYATALARAGVDLRTTQRLMRHSTPLLTAKHYTRLDLEDLAEAAGKLPSPLAGSSQGRP